MCINSYEIKINLKSIPVLQIKVGDVGIQQSSFCLEDLYLTMHWIYFILRYKSGQSPKIFLRDVGEPENRNNPWFITPSEESYWSSALALVHLSTDVCHVFCEKLNAYFLPYYSFTFKEMWTSAQVKETVEFTPLMFFVYAYMQYVHFFLAYIRLKNCLRVFQNTPIICIRKMQTHEQNSFYFWIF